MCNQLKTIAKSKSGELTKCLNCNIFHLTFNNIYFEFNEKHFYQFKEYVLNIEIEYWEQKYPCQNVKRKIPLPTLHQNLILIFNRQEITELQLLFSKKKKSAFINVDDIDYTFILN